MTTNDAEMRADFEAWWRDHADPNVGNVENQIKKQAALQAVQWATRRAGAREAALIKALDDLIEVAERCDGWESFPEAALATARAAAAAPEEKG